MPISSLRFDIKLKVMTQCSKNILRKKNLKCRWNHKNEAECGDRFYTFLVVVSLVHGVNKKTNEARTTQ